MSAESETLNGKGGLRQLGYESVDCLKLKVYLDD